MPTVLYAEDDRAIMANVRALLRRVSFHTDVSNLIEVGDLRLDEAARRARRGSRELELTRTEFDLLAALARNAGSVMTVGVDMFGTVQIARSVAECDRVLASMLRRVALIAGVATALAFGEGLTLADGSPVRSAGGANLSAFDSRLSNTPCVLACR